MGSRRKFHPAESSYEQTRQTAEALSFGVKTLRRGRLIPRTIMSIYCTLSVPLINPSTNHRKTTFTLVRDSLLPWPVHCLREFKAVGKRQGERRE